MSDNVFVECPQCKRICMPKGNKFCSLKCYNSNFNKSVEKEFDEIKDKIIP